ncbi:MAG: hypothetical protein ACFFC7_29840 [Candidatus Hermodarchaeota archaeon]
MQFNTIAPGDKLFVGEHMSKKNSNRNEKNLDLSPSKEAKMDRTVNLKKKRRKNIPIPPKNELVALYHGTHPACKGRPFTQQEIADYYASIHNQPVSQQKVSYWFCKLKIKANHTKFQPKIPMPSREELITLYYGTHPACNGSPFTQQEIADYYASIHNRSIARELVTKWFSELEIETRPPFPADAQEWEDLAYESAEILLASVI